MPGFASGSPCLFQFTPLREGRQIAGTHARRFPHFNSRPSARGDRKPKVAQFNFYDFNSRPSARGDGKLGQEN